MLIMKLLLKPGCFRIDMNARNANRRFNLSEFYAITSDSYPELGIHAEIFILVKVAETLK